MNPRRRYTEAFIVLSRCAWAATEARQQHGADSPEYRAAREATDEARDAFRLVVEEEKANEACS